MFFDHYPYTNFHNVNLDWVLQAVKAWGNMVEANDRAFKDLKEANEDFKRYVRNYLQDLDVSDEINAKLDRMLAEGTLTPYFAPYVKGYVESWLASNVTPTTPALDKTLSLEDAAANAAATGERIERASFLRTLDRPDLYKMLNKDLIIPGYRIQSACHAEGYFYVCGGSDAADGNGFIAKMRDLDFKDAEIAYIQGIGHANDITYNNNDHYLYITTVGEGVDWGILKINPHDYTDKTLITNCPTNTIGIQFVYGWTYILAPYHIYRTLDFENYTLVIDNTNDILNKFGIQSENRISQTLVRLPDNIFGWVGSFIKDPEHTWYGFIVYFGSNGAITFDLFPTYHAECQAGVWDGHTIYFLNNGTSKVYTVLKTDAGDLKFDLLVSGKDLNDYTGEGVYYLLGAAEMNNCPVNNEGLTLRVGPQGLLNTRQDIYTNHGRHLYRIKLFNPGTWSEWSETAAEISQIKEDLSANNSVDLAPITISSKVSGGITWTQTGKYTVNVNGTATSTSLYNLYMNDAKMPDGMVAGEKYFYDVTGATNVDFRFLYHNGSAWISLFSAIGSMQWNGEITIPADAVGLIIRLAVSKGDTADNETVTVHVKNAPSNAELHNAVVEAPKPYYAEEIATTISEVNTANSEPGLVFMVCSDIHYKSKLGTFPATIAKLDSVTDMTINMTNIRKYIAVDALVCLGDIIDSKDYTTARTKEQIKYVMSRLAGVGLPLIYAMGNHDDNRYIDGESFTPAEVYSYYVSKSVNTRISDMTYNGLNYYIDYPNYNVRVLVVDENYFDGTIWHYGYADETVTWFRSQLANVPSGYGVLVFTHRAIRPENNIGSAVHTNQELMVNAVQNYINNGGLYIATIFGHNHTVYSNTTPWLEIAIGASKAHNTDISPEAPAGATVPERVRGTASEDLWDVMILQPFSRKIKMVRFGAGENREFTY